MLGVCFVLAGASAFRLTLFLLSFPELDAFRSRPYSRAVTDRYGAVLRVSSLEDGLKREWLPLDDIAPGVLKIFLRAEDRRFYFHPGVDPIALGASLVRNLRAGRVVSGASTITMQLARMVHPRPRTLAGKWGELWDALRLEAKLPKDRILELWLNGIPFGSNIEGVSSMARARFGISAAALDDAEALLLAVVPRRPGRYDPAIDPESAAAAALRLAHRMGLALTEAEMGRAAEAAAAEPNPFLAPHFTERVLALVSGDTSPGDMVLNGASPGAAPGALKTTLDLELQSYAETRLESALDRLQDRRVGNGAVLAVENDTGKVLVYIGSRSWFDLESAGRIDGVRATNQSGSCLKPFLYAHALDSGFLPGDTLPDIPTVFGGAQAYAPTNFNRRFYGPVRFRVALASSLNIPAVYLLERLGVARFEEYLVGLGFSSLVPHLGSYGTGLALGNAEVSLEELVRGFSSFPRGGTAATLRFFEDQQDPREGPGDDQDVRAMSPYAAWMISDILSDKSSRFTGFGPDSAMSTPFSAMFKTGTANQFQHIWALGATRRFTVGVWMGNPTGETVVGTTGSSVPARLAAELLGVLESTVVQGLSARPSLAFVGGPIPPDTHEVEVCSLSGKAATPYCSGTLTERFPKGNIPPPCDWHVPGGSGEGVVLRYPAEYRSYLSSRSRFGETSSGSHSIRRPAEGSVFYSDPSIPAESQALRVEAVGFSPESLVLLNGIPVGVLDYAGLAFLPLSRGRWTLRVEDSLGYQDETTFEVR
jgi:penicillin-binding protein 1C